ncbi:dynein light intermediate chain-domain-containing protein [Stachybotrys elegans]|uniref:Dynein light intermediate chain-domain-containing protein n=1 Tax=Stachybotrys elegans TaxID=80388 RepID=A0A8K0SND1_9HYPO|nr:dynein light intermediate chain-domain-containing protein [Stachybotrys elegans]
MTANANRVSTYTAGSGEADARNGDQKKNLWKSMLESVASGKRLPEKNILVLGGTAESQRDFLESLSSSELRRNNDRQKAPPIATNFALGYAYYDVLDADQDDTLARVSLYLLTQPSGEFASLVAPLLTPETIPHTAVVILLDWMEPHLWLRQLCSWIQVLEEVMGHMNDDEREQLEEVMASWKERGRGGASTNLDGTPSTTGTTSDGDGLLPLGPGEWSEPLGLPLCVVCQNAQRMESLEKNNHWKEPDFDTVLQYLRTVLLRHGASLIYTSQNAPSQLPSLMHSTLGITSLLKRQPLKHNVIDRDRIVVPPNWDSWGKIRVLGGSFDTEVVSRAWSEDIKAPLGSEPFTMEDFEKARNGEDEEGHVDQDDSAITRYEDWCREPNTGGLAVVESAMKEGMAVGVESDDTQDFLERQLKILEAFKSKAPELSESTASHTSRQDKPKDSDISEHIGPVQFNMGGIQVDADDMLQRIKDRNAPLAASETTIPEAEATAGNMAKEYDTDQLQNFFSGLMRGKGGS